MKNIALTSDDIANLFDSHDKSNKTDTLLPTITANGLLDRLTLMQVTPDCLVDLGCGDGQLTQKLIQRYPQASVIGIDLAFTPLQQAAEHCDKIIQADATSLPLAHHSVDVIIANLSLAWRPLAQLLQTCQQLLRANGLLLFTTFGPDLLKSVRSDYCSETLIDMHDIGDQLVSLGFKDPVMESDYYPFRYSSRHTLERECQALGLSPLITLAANSRLDVTFEIIYGHAWASPLSTADDDGTIAIPLSKISRRQKTP